MKPQGGFDPQSGSPASSIVGKPTLQTRISVLNLRVYMYSKGSYTYTFNMPWPFYFSSNSFKNGGWDFLSVSPQLTSKQVKVTNI